MDTTTTDELKDAKFESEYPDGGDELDGDADEKDGNWSEDEMGLTKKYKNKMEEYYDDAEVEGLISDDHEIMRLRNNSWLPRKDKDKLGALRKELKDLEEGKVKPPLVIRSDGSVGNGKDAPKTITRTEYERARMMAKLEPEERRQL